MKKPIILGVLGLFIGYFIYLMINLFSTGPVDSSLGGWIAIVTGVICFFIGEWYYTRGGPNEQQKTIAMDIGFNLQFGYIKLCPQTNIWTNTNTWSCPVSDIKWEVTLLRTFLSPRLPINESAYVSQKMEQYLLIAEVLFKNKNDPENKIIQLNELLLQDTKGNKIMAIGNIDRQLNRYLIRT